MSMLKEKIQTLISENVNFSDILVKTGDPVRYRVPAGMTILDPTDFVESGDVIAFLEQYHGRMDYEKMLEENGGHLDFSLECFGCRFRCNMFWFSGKRIFGLSLRKLNSKIPTLEQIQTPGVVASFAQRSSGLVLVTGATGSGKSTTLAALIGEINRNSNAHIITLEDPIEYVHENALSSVTQREVGSDVASFSRGLTAALREDPDVILIGEIRDRATAEAALMAAETGHLVFSTLHTTSAAKTIERMTDFFDSHEKDLMRNVLSSVLAGIVSQILIPDRQRVNRLLVCEVLMNTPPVGAIIRKNALQQLPNEMAQSSKDGMLLLNRELAKLVVQGQISKEVALYSTYDPAGLAEEIRI